MIIVAWVWLIVGWGAVYGVLSKPEEVHTPDTNEVNYMNFMSAQLKLAENAKRLALLEADKFRNERDDLRLLCVCALSDNEVTP